MHENSPIFFVTLEVFIYEATCWSNNSFEQLVAFRDTLISGELILAGCMFFVVSLGGTLFLDAYDSFPKYHHMLKIQGTVCVCVCWVCWFP